MRAIPASLRTRRSEKQAPSDSIKLYRSEPELTSPLNHIQITQDKSLYILKMSSTNEPVTLDALLKQILLTKAQLNKVKAESLSDCTEKLSDHEAAKLQVSLAYTLASLYFVLLRVSGKDAAHESDVSTELDRIKQYVVKLNRINGVGSEVAKRPLS